jgi:hypothetical protein
MIHKKLIKCSNQMFVKIYINTIYQKKIRIKNKILLIIQTKRTRSKEMPKYMY